MKDVFLEQVAFVAHRFVEGQMSYDDLVKAVKDYADDCGVPLSPSRRCPNAATRTPAPGRRCSDAARLSKCSNTAAQTPVGSAGAELEGPLERCLVMLRKALAKQNNRERVAVLCARLQLKYWKVNLGRRIYKTIRRR